MLQKIVFQDNVYQISRSIDTVYEGLLLDLSHEYFFDKTVDDILFFDVSIQRLYKQIQSNPQVTGYIHVLQALYTCQSRYLVLLELILSQKCAMKDNFTSLTSKLTSIREIQVSLRTEIGLSIQKNDKSNDTRDIVSQNELSELLNF